MFNRYDLRQRLEEFLIYGSYPEIVVTEGRKEKIELLEELAGSYLLKDVLALERIRSSRTLVNLLKLIAFQVGSQVSLNELATQVKPMKKWLELYPGATFEVVTPDNYLDFAG